MVETKPVDSYEPVMIRACLMSPCHPQTRLVCDPKNDPPNILRCEGCRRVWQLGVCVPVDEILLYTTQAALSS